MAKKIEGLVVTDINCITKKPEYYSYKGVSIRKNIQSSYRGVLGQKTLAKTYYSFNIHNDRYYFKSVNTLAEVTGLIDKFLADENYMLDGVSIRKIA